MSLIVEGISLYMLNFVYKGGYIMQKYLVEIIMSDGQSFKLRTNTDVREIDPVKVDELGGSEMLIIDDELMLEVGQIEELPMFPIKVRN